MPCPQTLLSSHKGTRLKTSFTMSRPARYRWAMLLLAAAAIAASIPQGAPQVVARASVQARATVRIISGAEIRFAQQSTPDVPAARETLIRNNGVAQPAKLVEFQ